MSTTSLVEAAATLRELAFPLPGVGKANPSPYFDVKCRRCGKPATEAGRAHVSADLADVHAESFAGFELRFEKQRGTARRPRWFAAQPYAVDETGRGERLYLVCPRKHGGPVKLETLMRQMLDEHAKGRNVIYFGG